MDDPGQAWPFWKFGLKREDLSGKLHDQYNTFPSSIQDPEAFHHDVFELSHEADTEDEFYRLLAGRKQQRLRELNDSLESAAFEIIGNPDLIGTEQWQYALQLFRTKSLDSLVRYFASYLPSGSPWPPKSDDEAGSPVGSVSDVGSSVESIAHSHNSFFGGDDKRPIMTDEPLDFSTSAGISHLPPSPRSMTMCSVSSAASPMDVPDDKYEVDSQTPARMMSTSFSEPESDHEALLDSRSDIHHGEMSRPETPATSVSDVSETDDGAFGDIEPGVVIVHKTFELEVVYDDNYETDGMAEEEEEDERRAEAIANAGAEDELESETPTPKPDPPAASFFDTKLSLPRRQHRSVSPSRPHPLSQEQQQEHPHRLAHHLDYRTALRSARSRRRDSSPAQERRQSPAGHATRAARIRKPLPGPTRLSRPRTARHADC